MATNEGTPDKHLRHSEFKTFSQIKEVNAVEDRIDERFPR